MLVGLRRAACAAAALLCAFAASRTAQAQREGRAVGDALSVEPSCIDPKHLADAIARFRGNPAIDPTVGIEVRGDPLDARGVTVRLRKSGQVVGERHFERFEGTCDRAEAAVALAASIALDALDAGDLREAQRAPLAPLLPGVPVATVPLPLEPKKRAHLSTDTDAFVLLGTLGAPAVGVAPGLSVTSPSGHIRVRASAWLTFPASPAALTLGNGTTDLGLVLARLELCAAPFLGDRVRLWACPGAAAGAIDVNGRGYLHSFSRSTEFVGLSGRGAVEFVVAPGFALRAASDLVVSAVSANVRVTGSPNASESLPAVGVALNLGFVVTIF